MSIDPMFIDTILIKDILHLKNVSIAAQGRHIIFTGRNGSGKTTVLNHIAAYFEQIVANSFPHLPTKGSNTSSHNDEEVNRNRFDELLTKEKKSIDNTFLINILFTDLSNQLIDKSLDNFIFAYFGAKRNPHFIDSKGVEKLELTQIKNEKNSNAHFIKYLVHLKTQQAYALLNGNTEKLSNINQWFTNFENALQEIFETKDLQLKYNEDTYNFTIIENGRSCTFNTLSDGYSSVIDIMTEIMLRMQTEGEYNTTHLLSGVVLIDEIETHLHIGLQKKILRVLTAMFPNIQFIVSSHSPFVLNSIENAVVYDLERMKPVTNLSAYSYDRIVETHFENSKYNAPLETKLQRYKQLIEQTSKTESEIEEEQTLHQQLNAISVDMAPWAYIYFRELEIKRLL